MMTRLWLRSTLTIRVLVSLVLLLPFFLAMPYAIRGPSGDPFGDIFGLLGLVGGLISSRIREPEYWRLDKQSRQRVREVQYTGQPSGDRQLDEIAAGRLSRDAEKDKANRVAVPVALGLMIAIPVVAALLTGHEWWLLASLPAVLCLAGWLPARRREGPQARLDRLVDRIGGAASGG
jgi:hypothetical protein